MAKQTIVTTPAVAKDSKLGTPIADAFKMVNDNFTELYAEPSISLVGNTLTLTRPDDSTSTVDLAPYLDEDARAISSGTIDGAGLVTFTRDDATTFTLDLSSLLDNTNLVTSVAGKTGVVTLVKGDVGLGNVDNTSDANKPISTATQTALDLKANLASPTFTGTVGGVSKGMVGLGNVDNTSDANKPVSTAGQTALNLKYDASNPAGYTSNAAANNATITLTAGNGLSGGGTFTTDQSGVGEITFTVGVDDSTTELASDQVRVKDLGITTAKLAADAVDGTKIADDSIDSEHYVDGSIDTAHIADDQITHDKLEARYTAVQDIATTSGTINLDASSYAAFNLTGNLTTATLNVQNIKTGQAIDILLSGTLSSAVITLADDFTTSAINKVGSNDLDTTGTNLIQVLCVDDTDADAILTWAVATYTTDTSA
jgi:hypothetical protein